MLLLGSYRRVPALFQSFGNRVINAIETPAMREESPGEERPSFTPAEDLAEAIAFLCSDSAGRMNGQRLALHP